MNKAIDEIRSSVRKLAVSFAKIIDKSSGGRITPNTITIIGLLAHIYIAWLIAYHYFVWAGILLIIFGLLDAVDGSLARLQNSSSQKGMLLDSITDRLKEAFLYAGIAYAIITTGEVFYAVWVVLACGFSIIVSYVNAWGEVVASKSKISKSHTTNQVFRGGFMTYDIRMFVLVVGLLSGHLKFVVIFIAIFSFFTILDRFQIITKKLP